MPYGFKYEAFGEDGGGHTRQESADGSGRVVGSYSIFTPEGLMRRVFYEADENGFRAHIETNEPGTKTSNPADVTIVSTAGGGSRDQPLPNAATTRPVKTPSPADGGVTKPIPETTTGLPPGYVLPERYRPNASRRPEGAELLTSRILTLDQPVDYQELYPGRPGFESDLNPQGPPNSLRTGSPPSGIVPVGPVQISRVPGRPGGPAGFRPRPHTNYAPSKNTFGQFDGGANRHDSPAHPSYEGSSRIPAGSSGGIFSPSQVAPKDNAAGPQALDRPGQDGRAPFPLDGSSGPSGPGSKTTFPAGAPRGQGVGSRNFGSPNPAFDSSGAFRGGPGVGQNRQHPGLGAPLFTRITPDSPRIPGRVDYGYQPSYTGSFQPGPPGAFGVPGGQPGGRTPSFGNRGPFSGRPGVGLGGSVPGLPLDAPGAGGPGGSSHRGFGQPSLAGRHRGSQPPSAGAPGARPDYDGGNSEESSNEDGFAPNDPRRPFLFRNEPPSSAAALGPQGPGSVGPGNEGGTYAIHADNGKIESVDFQPDNRPFRGNSPSAGFGAGRNNVQGRPFRRPAFGGTRRDDRFRPYKPPPIESGHPDRIFVPQSFSGPGSRPNQFDFRDPQRIDGFGPPHHPSNFGGQRSPGVSPKTGFNFNQLPGGQQAPGPQQNTFGGGPRQSLTPFGQPGRVPPVPTIANVGSIPNPRNHFANRQFDRTPAGTSFGRPAIHTPSLISMEVIRYGPHGPQVQRLNGSAVPGSLAPPENLEIGGPLRPAGFPPGSNQGHPLLANRIVPRPPRPSNGNVNRVLYGEAHHQPPFPRRLSEPKGPEGDFGSGFEGLIRDERPDLLELKPRPRPSVAGAVRPGDNLDFLEELLPFYEKDAEIGKKGNEAAGDGERKPVIHEPIVPTHRELLCDDDDPRFSDPRRPSVDTLLTGKKPDCIRRRKPEGDSRGGSNQPDGQNEPPVDADAEFLNYRNPFSGVLPSPELGTAEKVDRDGKNFRRPFLDKDGNVIPVLVDRSQPGSGELDGTVEVDRNKVFPSSNEAGLPDRPPVSDLDAQSPIEGRRGFGNDGTFRPNFGAFGGPPRSPGPVGGFGGPGDGQFSPFAPLPPRHQDGNVLNFQNIPRRNINADRDAQNPFRRSEGPPEESPFLPPPPQPTLRFGQRLSGARNPASLVPSQRPPRVQTGAQPQLTPQGQVIFPPPPLNRKAVFPGPAGPVNGLGDSRPFSPVQTPGVSGQVKPRGGFGQLGGNDSGGGAFDNAGVAPPRFEFVDSRRLGPGLGRSPGRGVGREDVSPDSEGQPISRGPTGSSVPRLPASEGKAPKFSDENTPPATFTFSDANKASLVPRRQNLGNGGRKRLKNTFDDSDKSGPLQGPGRALSQERGDLLRKPLLETNGQINEELNRRVASGVPSPFNFVDTRKPLESARRRVGDRRPQVFNSAGRPGVGTVPGDEQPAVLGAPLGGNLGAIPGAGFPGAPQELRKQLIPTEGPAGGAVEGPVAFVPQGEQQRQPLQTPQPVLLSVERLPVGRRPAVGDGSVTGRSSFGVQPLNGNVDRTAEIASQELLRRGVDSTGPNEAGEGQEQDGEQRVNPYSFGYSSYDGLGSKVSRHESKDDSGRVTGYYVVEDVDGRKRTVHYVADKDGFRATVHTNEQGTENQDPADVKMRVENRMPHPPPTPQTPAKALPASALADDVDAPVLDAVDQSVKKS